MMKYIDINWTKTKNNVENLIDKYLCYNLSIDYNSSSLINDNYTLEKIGEVNLQYSKISQVEQSERINFINYVRMSFNKLTCDERKIIYWTYLDKENNYDDRFIANSLGFSLGYYYIKKKETLIRFAYSLGIEEKE